MLIGFILFFSGTVVIMYVLHTQCGYVFKMSWKGVWMQRVFLSRRKTTESWSVKKLTVPITISQGCSGNKTAERQGEIAEVKKKLQRHIASLEA